MPAAERSFSETPPTRVYVDTDLFIAHLVATQPHHERSRRFFERLAAARSSLVLSSLVWIEFVHVITRENFRAALADDLRSRFQLDRWAQTSIRRRYVGALSAEFDALLAQFEWDEVFVTREVREAASEYVVRYALRSQDAVHLASSVGAGVADLASFDETFRRVDDIVLWNDLIHARSSSS